MNKAAERYLLTLRAMRYTLESRVLGGSMITAPDGSDGAVFYGRMLSKIAEARVFDFGSEIVRHTEIDVAAMLIDSSGARADYERWLREEAPVPAANGDNAARRVIEYTEDLLSQMPFPIDMLPFPVCWLGFGDGVGVTDQEIGWYKRDMIHNGVKQPKPTPEGMALFVGVLVQAAHGGTADAVFLIPAGDELGFATIEWVREGRWVDYGTLASPWLIWGVLNILHDSRSIIAGPGQTSFGWRRNFHRAMGDLKLPAKPKPYYEVTVEPRYVMAKLRQHDAIGKKIWTHRHDRRAHERCRVLRGAMPLEPAHKLRLVKRGYAVYDETPPAGEDARRVMMRGFPPKRADEWIAILPYWVEACVVGPEDLPYVPSTHVVKEAKEALR